MKITLDIDNIDYGALAELFLPLIHDKLAEKDGAAVAILTKIAGMPPMLTGKMIDMLPQDAKDEIAAMLVNKNKEKIIESVTKFAAQKGLSFPIDDFSVE